MGIETVYDARVAHWVIDGISGADLSDIGEEFVAVGFVRDNVPLGGVVYTDYSAKNKSVNILIRSNSQTWLKPSIVRKIFEIPFEKIGAEVIRVGIREGNKRSERLCRRVGFRKEGVHRKAWDGKTNMLTFSLLKSECKYLGKKANG